MNDEKVDLRPVQVPALYPVQVNAQQKPQKTGCGCG
jgi:hypothetical protein